MILSDLWMEDSSILQPVNLFTGWLIRSEALSRVRFLSMFSIPLAIPV